jgi:transposase
MRITTLVPDPAAVTLEEIVADDAGVTLVARARRAQACCPLCGEPATRVHSWYARRLADLPWQGLAVRLHLRSRRWFCDNPACARRIFTERLPTVVAPHGQRTQRLATIVLVFGVAVGGAPGARLLSDLGIAVSGDTLRRAVCAAALPDADTPRVLGVDDWSLKKGRTYGTILVDLEAHRPVDLLPDRSAASLKTWLKEHPGVEIICRDRGGAYADGARQGAPAAAQVADRWHLFANLGDMLERLLSRHHAALGQVRLVAAAPPAPVTAGASNAECPTLSAPPLEPPPPTRAARERERRDARREARYAEIHALHRQGLSIRAIARHLGINKRTVQKYLAVPSCPHPGPRPNRRRAITPFLPYLRERWAAGEHRVGVLWAEIRERGFPGAAPRVREALAPWRREARAVRQAAIGVASPPAPPPPPAGKRCAPRRVAAWLVRESGDLKPTQQAYLDALVARCPALDTARTLARDFAHLLRERDATGLEAWLVAAESCDVAEIREFAIGIRRDQPAVQAALEHAWSSGQVEGQVNRLKLVKRQAYGRAGFALLRRRYLLAS